MNRRGFWLKLSAIPASFFAVKSASFRESDLWKLESQMMSELRKAYVYNPYEGVLIQCIGIELFLEKKIEKNPNDEYLKFQLRLQRATTNRFQAHSKAYMESKNG